MAAQRSTARIVTAVLTAAPIDRTAAADDVDSSCALRISALAASTTDMDVVVHAFGSCFA